MGTYWCNNIDKDFRRLDTKTEGQIDRWQENSRREHAIIKNSSNIKNTEIRPEVHMPSNNLARDSQISDVEGRVWSTSVAWVLSFETRTKKLRPLVMYIARKISESTQQERVRNYYVSGLRAFLVPPEALTA